MTIAESIPHAVSFALSLSDACVVIAIVGCLFTLAAMVCVVTFPHIETDDFAAEQPVTILKPLHDLEPELPARLRTFCEQDYSAPVQILCGTRHNASPSVEAVRAMVQSFPDTEIELVVEQRSHGVNRKVSNLINMMPRARHGTLVLSDSDIVVGSNYLRTLTAPLASPRGRCRELPVLWHRERRALDALLGSGHQLAISAVRNCIGQPWAGETVLRRDDRAARSMLDRMGGFGASCRRPCRRSCDWRRRALGRLRCGYCAVPGRPSML